MIRSHHLKSPSTALLLVLATATAPGLDWPNWRGPDHNGVSKETGWTASWSKSGPEILWKARVGTGFSSVAVAQGRVFTMGNEENRDTVHALDAATGKELWRHAYDEPLSPKLYEGGPNTTPTVEGDHLYTVSRTGKLFCFEAGTGRVVWTRNVVADLDLILPDKDHWGIAGSPLIQGDLLILNAGRAGVALRRTDGEPVWSTGREACGFASPVPFVEGTTPALAIFAAKGLVAVERGTGRELWQFPWKTSWDINAADPVVHGNRVFISSGYGSGCALLDFSSGQPREVWRNKNMRNHFNSSVRVGPALYGFDESELKCMDWETGRVNWAQDGLGKGSLMAAGDRLIILSERGELVVAKADPVRFQVMARGQVLGGKCWTMPVLSHGRIYCRNARGDLVCVEAGGSQ